MGEIITEYKETVDSECTLPILTSSKTEGVILQEEHFGRKQQHDITGYNILPRNYCTYRNRSDGVDFTFNINKCCDKGIISKFYPVFSGKNSDVFFLSLVLNNSDGVVREIAYTCTGTGQKVLSFLDLQKMKVRVPSYDEQKEIAAYFENLDHLITLHQCKCQIDGCRFQSPLAITWEQRKFGEVFDCTVPNNTLSRAELSYDEGTVLNVHYGDVLIKYGSVLDVQKDDIPRIPHRCREDFNGALLQDGDVIIADTAEDETTGKACEIGNLQGSAIVSGLHTMVCRPRNRMALGYLGYYLNSNAYHYQLLPLMQGIKVLSLSRSNIQKTSVSYPSAMKEQQLIASYFSQLDHLITLHQCE